MSEHLKDQYYIKLSSALFRMTQFQETPQSDALATLNVSWPMQSLPGRRFVVVTTDPGDALIRVMSWHDTNPIYDPDGTPAKDDNGNALNFNTLHSVRSCCSLC